MCSFECVWSLFTIKGQILTLLLPQEDSQAEKAAAETFSRKLLMVPPGSAKLSFFGCYFAGLLQGTPMADVDEGVTGVKGVNTVEVMKKKWEL